MAASLQGADEDFANSVNAYLKFKGGKVGLTSGFRSNAEQQSLWNTALKKYGSEAAARKYVAKPGGSNHEHGVAADLSNPGAINDQELAMFGLWRPMPWEPWHVEKIGTRDGKTGKGKAAQTTPPDTTPTAKVMQTFGALISNVGEQDSSVGAVESSVGEVTSATQGNPTPLAGQEEMTSNVDPSNVGVQGGEVSGIDLDDLTPEQQQNATTIINIARQRGLSDKAIIIALSTAMQESGLRNLKYGDRDSQGMFQQRPSQGWGSVAQVTDPVYATNKFFDSLVGTDYERLPVTVAAQKVQRSAFPDAYAKHEQRARQILGSAR